MAAAWRDKIGRVMDVRNILGRARSPRWGGWPLRRVKHGNRIGTGATRRGQGRPERDAILTRYYGNVMNTKFTGIALERKECHMI